MHSRNRNERLSGQGRPILSREWADKGVRVNSITPGFFPAEQNRRLLFEEDGTPTERGQQILSHTPMNRFGRPEELVGAAVFLASDAASGFVTGTDIRVDGGFWRRRSKKCEKPRFTVKKKTSQFAIVHAFVVRHIFKTGMPHFQENYDVCLRL